MLAAFCAGAGLDPHLLAHEDPLDLMRSMGRLCREMTGGLRDVLSARASIKSEYRVEQTMIGSINNNPLKFSPDADQALAALLGRPRPGYVGGPEAVRDGFDDLKAHELALLSGMQTAVAALLREFDPAQLTRRLERKSLLQNLVPGARRAKYWDAYENHYKQIVAEVADDVRGTFGRAFAKAYEAASKKT
jgi:type VI secretion system protein